MSDQTFNLLREPWIKVRHLDGAVSEVGLLELYERAEEFSDLAGESPTQDQAVFRLLEAILIRALRDHAFFAPHSDVVSTWQTVQGAPELGELVNAYLLKHEARFDLFDPVAPFFQVADLRTAKGEHPDASALIPDVGPGLFSTSTAAAGQRLPAAVAVRWLVYTQAYDLSGIKSGAVGDPRVKGGKGYPIGTGWAGAIGSVQLLGPTLRDTLVLNLPVEAVVVDRDEVDADLPPWEREPDGAAPRSDEEVPPRGVVDVMTWQQRRIRLFPGPDGMQVDGVLICNGDKIQRANNFVDPTTGYRYSKAQSKNGVDVFFPKTHDPELTVWRGIQSLFTEDGSEQGKDRKPFVVTQLRTKLAEAVMDEYGQSKTMVRLTGMSYGTQDAVINGEISETYPVTVKLLGEGAEQLRATAVQVVQRVLSFRGSMSWFHRQLLVCGGAAPEEAPVAPVQSWLAALETEFAQWLNYLGSMPTPQDAEADWARRMTRVTRTFAAQAVEAAGPRAAIGRSETSESGNLIIHSSARYETWILSKLSENLHMSKGENPS
ncbi:type I-E CRISPR-associated protein Cse1/CasA [Kocuria varians]|uniref:type I-E CRISPR-associated protein Cse1/CasA n=1 Tax=Kocuria varians TaxID=1272 RepID=UPI0009EF2D80|nr:type I-E CRISPR-associated protein Cse1/CasA [Kocuria varians]